MATKKTSRGTLRRLARSISEDTPQEATAGRQKRIGLDKSLVEELKQLTGEATASKGIKELVSMYCELKSRSMYELGECEEVIHSFEQYVYNYGLKDRDQKKVNDSLDRAIYKLHRWQDKKMFSERLG